MTPWLFICCRTCDGAVLEGSLSAQSRRAISLPYRMSPGRDGIAPAYIEGELLVNHEQSTIGGREEVDSAIFVIRCMGLGKGMVYV